MMHKLEYFNLSPQARWVQAAKFSFPGLKPAVLGSKMDESQR
jgi:hypothetical protein